jgi:hypothetical protein
MKNLLITFFLTIISPLVFANKIDSLTDNTVKQFISPLIDKFIYKEWEVKSWQKVDLNNDGLTDLIAIEVPKGSNYKFNFVVMDKGNNRFQLIDIRYQFDDSRESIEPIKLNNISLLVFHGYTIYFTKQHQYTQTERTDTLIYKFNNFIEYNKTPPNYKIDSITYSSKWGWYGLENTPPPNTKPDQNLIIDHSGNAVYSNNFSSSTYVFTGTTRPTRNPKTDIGTFKCIIKKSDLKDICNLINYLSIKKLNDSYAITWTDNTSCYIRVKFKDGSVKYIADYGGSGTFGLKNLFAKLFALRDSQDWK